MGSTIAEASARVGRTPEEVSRALASYVRSILSGDSRFDRFVKGDRTALSDGEQRGLTLFRGKGNCTACRVGRTRATSARTTGVAWRGGLFAHEGDGRGAFKTPTLREIARTVPYMHDGSLASLEEVVEFYDRGGNRNPHLDEEIRPLRLTRGAKEALVAFPRTLSGDVLEGGR